MGSIFIEFFFAYFCLEIPKKYGFGGKRGRFKQNDQKTLNDMSGFKPRGSFAGGQKTTFGGKGKKGGGGGGAKRPGKRARDASKGRR